MNEFSMLALAWGAGLMLGVLFFGGLWWTVRRGISSARPATWFLLSLLVRMSVTLAGFYFVGHGDWRRLAACLLGFVNLRLLVTQLVNSPSAQNQSAPKESAHAP